ncbi:MAG: bifunctional alpha/beta hydrolase/OsmC family protein [Betaproteobacteria bacterium]|nr:bifunctional alpha/beta hydrolase/OsmC family protein [Betaproteobacteria bacterium]
MPDNTAAIRFPSSLGTQLAARLDLPSGPPAAFALFAHCFTCSKDTLAASRISNALTDHGFGVLRFDFTGLGGSDGDFANTNFSSNVSDLVAAAAWLREHHAPPKILIGHSLGGAAVLAAAHEIAEARALATIGAPFDPDHVRHLLQSAVPEIETAGEAEVAIAGRKFRIKKQFLDDLGGQDARARIAALRKALLVFHSPCDTTVDVENAAQIFTAAKHPKSFVSLDDADHLLTRRQDATYVAAVLSAWASRYVGAPPEKEVATGAPDAVTVTENREGKFTQTIVAGPHRLHADEPAALGGNDTAPSPYDLLLAGLGACTSMTLRMYAEQKQWPLERVSVELRHEKVHAEDCIDCETREGRIDRIEREVDIRGDLDAAQRARLLEIANKCPVHRTLHSEVWIPTRLKAE